MELSYTHESVRLTGRWDKGAHCATATAAGSYLEFAFEGRMALVHFDVFNNAHPLLHLWVQLDNGAMIESPIDSHLRVMAKDDGVHVCRIIYKGGTEADRRWYLPLTGKVSFVGVQVEKPAPLPADNRKTIEFVGDSITEGVAIDMDFNAVGLPENNEVDMLCRCHQDDVCATYAWLTAENLNLRPVFMGYGAVGVTRSGMGKVPAATESYLYNFENSPITHECVDYILINHGANDRRNGVETYLEQYAKLLDIVRRRNPNAEIIALSAFCGAFHEELGEMLAHYNQKNGCHVHFIDSNGWVPLEPLHPLRDGHREISRRLTASLKEIVSR